MQYILTEIEYKNLKSAGIKNAEENDLKLIEFCKYVANNLPIPGSHAENQKDAIIINGKKTKPLQCIMDKKDKTNIKHCNNCPSKELCPLINNIQKSGLKI